jgi:sialic acid synthase SpsE
MIRESIYSNKPYLIGETAYSFEGDYEYLMDMTNALTSKADAIKYHMLFDVDEYMVKSHSVYEGIKSWRLDKEQWQSILSKAKKNNLDTIILADDTASVDFCDENPNLVDAIEIHAACINDLALLDRAIEFSNNHKKVFVLGISGFEIQELLDIKQYLEYKEVKDILFMYGFQNYPTDVKNINLRKIKVLEEILFCKIGYADHTGYDDANKEVLVYSAFSLGCNIQEIHYVLEEGVERIDYSTAIGLDRLGVINKTMKTIYEGLGNPDFRLNEGEKKYLNFRKVPVYKSDLSKGYILTESDVIYKRVDTPAKQNKFMEIQKYYGKKLLCDVDQDSEIIFDDLGV